MKDILKNKKRILIISGLAICIILIVTLLVSNLNNDKKVECKRENQLVLGIDLDEDLIIFLNKDNKISRIKIEKEIKLDTYYQQFDTHLNAIYNHMSDAYKYLPKNTYTIEKKNDEIIVSVDTKEEGIILDNLEITRLSESDRKDIKINSSNILESSSSTYKIGDEYKNKELINKLKELGYTCKK